MACTKQRARSTSYDSFKDSDSTSEAQEMSETSDVGVSGFLDDEAEEGFLASELEECEWEASGESDSCDGCDDGGFIIDEAEEESAYRARKRRRKAIIESESDSNSEEVGGVKSKRRAYIADSSSDEEVGSKERKEASLPNSSDEVESSSEELESNCVDLESAECSSNDETKTTLEQNSDAVAGVKWKDGLTVRAQEAYKNRTSAATNLHKLVYSAVDDLTAPSDDDDDDVATPPVVGGLFTVTQKQRLLNCHKKETSLVTIRPRRDWSLPANVAAIKSLFVTGNWGAEDAATLLANDDAMYGDFEDLETGDAHTGGDKKQVEDKTDEQVTKKRAEKKLKQKTAFDSRFDAEMGDGYLEDLKREVSVVEQRNREEFEGLDETTRQLLEGIKPGSYVRMELKGHTLLTV